MARARIERNWGVLWAKCVGFWCCWELYFRVYLTCWTPTARYVVTQRRLDAAT